MWLTQILATIKTNELQKSAILESAKILRQTKVTNNLHQKKELNYLNQNDL